MSGPPDPNEFERKHRTRKAQLNQELTEGMAQLMPQQRAAVAAKLADPVNVSDRQALIQAGYKVGNSGYRVKEVWSAIHSRVGPVLYQAFGITMFEAAKVVAEAMRATKVVIGQRKFYKNGKLNRVDPVKYEIPDHSIRLRAVEAAMKSSALRVEVQHSINSETMNILQQREELALKTELEVHGAN